MCHQNSLRRRIDKVITYRKLKKEEKQSRYFNMKAGCEKQYQDRNPRYRGAFMCELWEKSKESYYEWLDKNFYEVPGENQMDVDKDILQYGNKQYHPDLCLVVPHNINVFYETIEVGKSNIAQNPLTKKYSVKVKSGDRWIRSKDIDTYNHALDTYCDIKQGILVSKAKALKDYIPEKVYAALMNTDIRAINCKHYRDAESEV